MMKMKMLLLAATVALAIPSVSKASEVILEGETYQCGNLQNAYNYCLSNPKITAVQIPAERDYYPYWIRTTVSCASVIAFFPASQCLVTE